MPDGEQARTAATEFGYRSWMVSASCDICVRKKPSLPVLVLTQRTRVEDRVQCLNTGADDYLAKPFSFSELSARIRALVRRSHLPSESVLAAANLRLDRVQRLVERPGRRIELTGKEFSLREYLMLNAGRRVTRSMIIEHVRNLTFDTTTNGVDVYINYVETTSTLHIAFGEGIDYSVLYAIEQMMGCHTETCMAVPSFVRKNLQSISGHRGESEVVFDIAIAFVWHLRKSASPAVVLFFGCVFCAGPDLHSTSCCALPRPTPSERFPCCVAELPAVCTRAEQRSVSAKAAPRVFHRNNAVLCDEQPLLSFLESAHWPHCAKALSNRYQPTLS